MEIVSFDADGVLTLPEGAVSVVYDRSHGLHPEPFERFFRNDWKRLASMVIISTWLWPYYPSMLSL